MLLRERKATKLCTNSHFEYSGKKNPDMAELVRGKCGRVMGHLLNGGAVRQAYCPIPMIVAAENGQTTVGPYSEVMNRAIQMEQDGDVISASVFSVQPWMDLKEVGSSVVVVTDGDVDAARNILPCYYGYNCSQRRPHHNTFSFAMVFNGADEQKSTF